MLRHGRGADSRQRVPVTAGRSARRKEPSPAPERLWPVSSVLVNGPASGTQHALCLVMPPQPLSVPAPRCSQIYSCSASAAAAPARTASPRLLSPPLPWRVFRPFSIDHRPGSFTKSAPSCTQVSQYLQPLSQIPTPRTMQEPAPPTFLNPPPMHPETMPLPPQAFAPPQSPRSRRPAPGHGRSPVFLPRLPFPEILHKQGKAASAEKPGLVTSSNVVAIVSPLLRHGNQCPVNL